MTSTTISRWWNSRFHDFPGFVAFLSLVASREGRSGPANAAVLHGLFESVHYVIPRGLEQTSSVAQLAEQLICNQQVAGSTPAASSARRIRRPVIPEARHRPMHRALRESPLPPLPVAITFLPRPLNRPPIIHSHPRRRQHAHHPRKQGEFPERSKGSDCKSDGFCLRRFESCTPQSRHQAVPPSTVAGVAQW